jgi:hypothetical protein
MNGRLLQRLTSARQSYREQGSLLRRVRRLYVRLVWPAIQADPTDATMNYCARRMAECQMYALPAANYIRPVRQSILRMAWKIETGAPSRFGHPNGWFFWLRRTGWTMPEGIRGVRTVDKTA